MFPQSVRPSRVLFRVDAGRERGLSYGHLYRCHILSQALQREWGCRTLFLMMDIQDGVLHARELGETVVPMESDFNVLDWSPQAILFDLPTGPDDGMQQCTRDCGIWNVVIDDVGNNIKHADVILNSSILAEASWYPNGQLLLLGPEYLILEDNWTPRARSIPNHHEPLHVVMTFGGSDPTRLTIKSLIALAECGDLTECRITVVLGPGFGSDEEVEKAISNIEAEVVIKRTPKDLLPILRSADLVICAGGRTLYELHAIGVPALPIASIDHEVPVVQAFLDRGFVPDGLTHWSSKHFLAALVKCLNNLRQSYVNPVMT